MYSTHNLEELISNKTTKKLIFVHTPKCGGTYVSSILSHLQIENKGHNKAATNEGITFTVIRNPVERFESLLNYRLGEKLPRCDWPDHLRDVYKNKNITLNEIVSRMTNKDILGFYPFKTLTYWTNDVDIIITLENLHKMLGYFGYSYDENLFPLVNVSNKNRGKLNEKNIKRIALLFDDDMTLYNKVSNSSFE